jgi:hypothetical protein
MLIYNQISIPIAECFWVMDKRMEGKQEDLRG